MSALIVALALAGGPLADIGPAPDVALIDSAGRPFRLSGLRGKVVVVSFVYTTCNGTCPLTTAGLDRVKTALKGRGLWGKRVEFVSISLDPERDTPEVLRRYAAFYRAEPEHWHFLTGSAVAVKGVLKAWDMWAKVGPGGALDHPSRIFLVDPEGRQREIYSLETLDPGTVAADVALLLDEAKVQGGGGNPR
jgi:protein SCO1/2